MEHPPEDKVVEEDHRVGAVGTIAAVVVGVGRRRITILGGMSATTMSSVLLLAESLRRHGIHDQVALEQRPTG
jgi:hypothetical protein